MRLFPFYFFIPIPYGKLRRREIAGSNTFINQGDHSDKAGFLYPKAIDDGPLEDSPCGGGILKAFNTFSSK